MTRTAGAVRIYYADRRAFAAEAAAALVTAEDRQRLSESMHPRRRAEFLAGRALLRAALARHTGRPATSFRIVTSDNGKPECVGGPSISVSHSGDLLVCALADVLAVGVDVETKTPRAPPTAIAERYYTAAEARWLAADPERRFRMLWVLKEAYLKALGVGLAGGLNALECRVEPPLLVAIASDGTTAPQLALLEGRDCHVGVAALGAPRAIAIDVQRMALDDRVEDAVGSLRLVATTE